MALPWSNPPTRNDWQAAAGILVELSQGRPLAKSFDFIRPGVTTPIPVGPLYPPAVVNVTDDALVVAVSGTNNYLQWVCHFLGSNQVVNTDFPGLVNSYFGQAASSLKRALADFEPLLADHKLVLFGHSFGAAIVQLLGSAYQLQVKRGMVCMTFGCPRVGDAGFAQSLLFPPIRLQNFGDIVPSFPPVNWVGTGTPWTGFAGLLPAVYVHGGSVLTIDSEGQFFNTDNTMSFTDAVSAAAEGKFQPHAIEEYQRLLNLIKEPDTEQWADAPALDVQLDWLASEYRKLLGTQLGGGEMSLIQGILYFKTSEETSGWGESFVANTDIATMLAKLEALAPVRAGCLANTCTIFAKKASNIDPGRAANQSQAMELDTARPGKASGTSIKDPTTTQTNETMDCLDYELLASTGQRRIFPFRGVPDSWIVGSQRSGDGVGADGKIQAFFKAVQAANLGFKVGGSRQTATPIDSIAVDPVTKLIVVTATAHGLLSGQLVTIRALKANPMVNGRWKIKVNDPNTFALVGSDKFQVTAAGQGTYQANTLQYAAIESNRFNSVSTRKIGRPFGVRRGKKSAKLLHH